MVIAHCRFVTVYSIHCKETEGPVVRESPIFFLSKRIKVKIAVDMFQSCQNPLVVLRKNFTSFFVFLPRFLCRASGEVNNDIVVEMKTDKANEEAGLLNKRPSTEQVRPIKGHGPITLYCFCLKNQSLTKCTPVSN